MPLTTFWKLTNFKCAFQVYNLLKENIEGSSAGTLSADSSNIVELVQEQYRAITSSIEMKDNATSNVRITYFSNCNPDDPSAPVKQTSICNELKVNSKVMFTGKLSCFCKRS